ncbi:MAG: PTS sugar transporter subunit IIA [Deltaproteobacteria bacterium RBG_13_52_11b]|nr:MAG: PTS sugar transporter subunit IIA [Deltaproteobacteria bacterium RBG_13_52_11b]
MNNVENKADTFLRMIRRAQRGHLKVYLGYAAGVGKTYQMLLEGHRLKEEGIDVAVGLVETHGRIETERLLKGLEVIPRRRQEYRGIVVEEMDVDAILSRKPEVALTDELAHTNVPGSRNDKRYQDVQDILAAGIHVITTLNIQHLETLYDTVEKAVGVKVRERIPDKVIAEADQIVSVDLTTEDLRERLKEGKVYTPERIEVALEHFFKGANLERLRELTLRELASQIDLRRRETFEEEESVSPDQVMVCLSSRGPNSDRLLRYSSRLAGRLNRNWYAVYVQTPDEEPTVIDTHTQQIISSTLTLAKQLGAIVFTYKGEDVVRTLLQFAKEYRVGHVVIGSPRPRSLWEKFRGKTGIVDRLIHEAKGITVTVLDTREEELPKVQVPVDTEEIPAAAPSVSETGNRLSLPQLISSERIVLWNEPVGKEAVLRRLVEKVGERSGVWDSARFLNAILEREEQGSTFFNEGVAFPHARIDGLTNSIVSLGLTRQGVSDEPTEKPVELVFLILSPAENPDEQIKILALASRASQDRHFRQNLQSCRTPEEVMAAIRNWNRKEEERTTLPS